MEAIGVAVLVIWIVVGLWSAVALARWHVDYADHKWQFSDTFMVIVAVIAGGCTFELVCFMPNIRPYLLHRVARRVR